MARDPPLTPASLSVPATPPRHNKPLSLDSGGSSPPDSSDGSLDGDDDGSSGAKLISVGKGTRPGTPVAGRGQVLGQRLPKVKDPVLSILSDRLG
jgi:hypothetical protein